VHVIGFGSFSVIFRPQSSDSLLLGFLTLAPSFRLSRRTCLAFLLRRKICLPLLFGSHETALHLRDY
jgi:hypothetical protein